VPDRLVASVAAGLPIAIPREGYEACKEYLRGYRAVIEFETPAHLASKLSDREEVGRLKNLAWEDRRRYVGEQHLKELIPFLVDVARAG
jgi:hypothetical protein